MTTETIMSEDKNFKLQESNGVLADVSTRLDFVWKLMGKKGLTTGERIQVRKAISDWAYQTNPNVEYDHKHNVYRNKQVAGYYFDREEEAEFIGALAKFIPNADKEKLIQVMSMMLKLFDVESAWVWKGTR